MNPKQKHEAVWGRERNRELLGKLPDSQVADIVGLSKAAVFRARRRYGIPAYARSNDLRIEAAAKGRSVIFTNFQEKHKAIWGVKENRELLGTMPDSEVAKIVGMSVGAVWRARQRFGISAAGNSYEDRCTAAKKGRQTYLEGQRMADETLLGGSIAHGGTKLRGAALQNQRLLEQWGR